MNVELGLACGVAPIELHYAIQRSLNAAAAVIQKRSNDWFTLFPETTLLHHSEHVLTARVDKEGLACEAW